MSQAQTSKPTIIAVDGPAASGKGTLARRIAAHYDYAYLDTGRLYRLVGFQTLQAGKDPLCEADAVATARQLQHQLDPAALDDPALYSDEAGNAASAVGQFAAVRQALYDFQVHFAQNPPNSKKGTVLDGRDIGTVICPDAPVKLYVTADTEIRAKRRYKELQSMGKTVTYEAVLADMRARDARDSGREAAPMKPADDAVILNTDQKTADEAFTEALRIIESKARL